jgi:glucose/arabinose dehydrogenase
MRKATALVLVAAVAMIGCADSPGRRRLGTEVRLVRLWEGLDGPNGVVSPPGDDRRVFVLEKVGTVRVAPRPDANLEPEPYLDIQAEVSGGNEQGLLGLAFHPDFSVNGRLFVNFTDRVGDTHIDEFVVADPQGGPPAVVTNRRTIFFADQPFDVHNGGHLAFGHDGLLYVGLGDGGGVGDPQANAQNPASPLGKILRVDVDTASPQVQMYASGLRNPWRFSFDRDTGDMWIADVGQDEREEINLIRRGSRVGTNFGWPAFEGDLKQSGGGEGQVDAAAPVAVYSHADGCAVVGGYVYRGPGLQAIQGRYVYGDHCSGRLWSLDATDPGEPEQVAVSTGAAVRITSFGEDATGRLYVTDFDGAVYRLE